MTTPNDQPKRLPPNPSAIHLKKQAKRLARQCEIQLAQAQHTLALEYGCHNWAELMQLVATLNCDALSISASSEAPPLGPLHLAARNLDLSAVQNLLASGQFAPDELDPSLADTLRRGDPATQSSAMHSIAQQLLAAGANPRRSSNAEQVTALHIAANRGPVELVKLLIRHGAKEWQPDKAGRKAVDYARAGHAADRERILELLDRPVIRDPFFKQAVVAVQTGNVPVLRQLLIEHPNLVHERAVEPDCYPQDYFRDPRLLWFIANNPILIPRMPLNSVEVAATIIDVGVQQADLDYTLGLVMTSQPAREQNLQRPLMRLLLQRGAAITQSDLYSTLGHRELDAVAGLLESGLPVTAPIAAALGMVRELAGLLTSADTEQRHAALSFAVINQEFACAKLCLAAGADPNRFMTVNAHSLPIHQAAIYDDVPMLKLLVEFGSRLDVRDTLWNGTPLGWALHAQKRAAETYLRSIGAE